MENYKLNETKRIIPYQIINNQPSCNSYNGKLPMMKYGLTNTKINNLSKEYESIGLLTSNINNNNNNNFNRNISSDNIYSSLRKS